MKYKCTILANGEFPKSNEALEAIHDTEFLCCCDGAVNELVKQGVTPNIIIGDCDSIDCEWLEKFKGIIIRAEEQQYNDLTKATIHCVSLGYKEITYVGCTGKREDHSIGNIFLMPFYFDRWKVKPTMLTDTGVLIPYRGMQTLKSFAGQQISVFNIDCTEMNSKGLKWPIYAFTQLWQGTLNEAVGNEFTIDADGIYLVYFKRTRD